MAELSASQNVKQSVRTMSLGFGDRMKTIGASAKSKDIDVALVKATTSRFHVVPKEKHVATLKLAVSGSRASANYVATNLLKRLQSSKDWLTALKTLIVVHRIIRETDAGAFMEEILRVGDNAGRGGRVLAVDNFLDTTNIEGRFDFSEWVRAYGKYLDEQLEVFSVVAWHIDLETSGTPSKLRSLGPSDLLRQLPYLQRLQRRLVDCVPRGQAMHDDVVLLSLSMVVKESFRLYKALSEGIINLADTFFSMDYLDASKGLEAYREAISGGEALSGYYTALQQIDAVKRVLEMPQLEPPPADFLGSMEAYVKNEAPRPAPTDGETSGEGSAAPVAAVPAVARVPLRKGRSNAQPSKQGSSYLDSAVQRDIGMLLPPGVTKPATPSTGSPKATLFSEEQDEGVGGNEVEVSQPPVSEEPQPAPPILDLLGFDEELPASTSMGTTTEHAGEANKAPTPQAPTAQPSALDLLSELDFGGFNIAPSTESGGKGPSSGGTGAEYSSLGQGSSAIPDAFVMHAASDVYGRPLNTLTGQPEVSLPHSVYGQQQPSPSYYQAQQMPGYGAHGAYGQQAPPWNAPPQPNYNQQSYTAQQVTGGYPTPPSALQPQIPFGGMPYESPSSGFGGSIGSASPWTASAPTPTDQRNPQPFREAGAHDPFSALGGLPQQSPPQTALRNSPGGSMTQGGTWK